MHGAGISRELLKWMHSMELSMQIKQPRRDCANGVVVAEILWRYFPRDVQLHSFVNATSSERKVANWNLLTKFFKRHGFEVSQKRIQDVMMAQPDAAVSLLVDLYSWLHGSSVQSSLNDRSFSRSFRGGDALAMNATLGEFDVVPDEGELKDEHCPHRQLLTATSKHSLTKHHAQFAKNQMEASQKRQEFAFDPPTRLHQRSQRAIDWNVILNKPERLYFVEDKSEMEDILPDHSILDGRSRNLSAQKSLENHRTRQWADVTSSKSLPALRRNRNTWEQQAPKDYWVLGKLGPDLHDPKRLEKQRAYDRMKEFSARVNEANKSIKTISTGSRPAAADPPQIPRRCRALEYSKSIRKPVKRDATFVQRQKERNDKRVLSDLARLEREHQQHRERMQAVAEEMRRRGL